MEDESGCTSECEEAEESTAVAHEKSRRCGNVELCVLWTGSAGKTPLIQFRANTILGLDNPTENQYTATHRLCFKFSGDNRLVRTILQSHGFTEVSWMNARFNVYWSGTNVQMTEIRTLMPHQRINHFPRSNSITRKDKLCENISRMQHAKGAKHFNIIPTTFVLPDELPQFRVHFRKKRGTWIVKPVSLSRGRGISVISHPNQLKVEEPMVVSQYIERPLCVNGYKFDLRIYVAVTSFNPLKIYIYEEGMARFATEHYSGPVQLDNLCMHLTNYSVNKKSSQYVRCESPDRDDYGSKWSMSALLRHLQELGKDVAELMMKVEDVIIKALIAGETHISSACDVFQTHRRNCFELYGFDILLDENLRPWLLEINLSPSLGCDTPFDLRLKSNLIADLLTLVGVPLVDPYTRETPKPPSSTSSSRHHNRTTSTTRRILSHSLRGLTSEEVAIIRESREEYQRRCGFVRVFPSHDSWDLYSSFLASKGRLNLILHRALYPGRIKGCHSPTSLSTVIAKRQNFALTEMPSVYDSPDGLIPLERVAVYLRKLDSGAKLKPLWDSVRDCLGRERGCSPETSTQPLKYLSDNIKKLSKVQARKVFAAYLDRVRVRLSEESSKCSRSCEADDKANLEVIVRFLKCAAKSLPPTFMVVEPDMELPLKSRKGMLACQLEEFTMLYTKETEELAANPNQALGLPGKVLEMALYTASEKELEGLLAMYAEHSHSSAVLFGSAKTRPQTKDSKPMLKSRNHMLSSRPSISRVLQRQSRVSRAHSPPHLSTSQPSFPPSSSSQKQSATHSKTQDKESTSSPPPYNYKKYSERSLETRSLLSDRIHHSQPISSRFSDTSGGKEKQREKLPPRAPRKESKGETGRRVVPRDRRLLRRTLSNQSLQSVSSNTSVNSHLSLGQSTSHSNPAEIGRPQSATLVSKTKPFVSPYAQPVLPLKRNLSLDGKTRTSAATSKPRKSRGSGVQSQCSRPLSSSMTDDEELVSEVLERLTLRQMSRRYTQSSLATTSQPRSVTTKLAWTSLS